MLAAVMTAGAAPALESFDAPVARRRGCRACGHMVPWRSHALVDPDNLLEVPEAALEALGKGGRMVHIGTTVADRQLAGSPRRLVLLP